MPLASINVFSAMHQADLARLANAATTLSPRDGATVFEQGDAADAVYAITAGEGRVRIGAVHHNSKALMVAVFNPGEIFGELGVLNDHPRTAAAVVEGRIELMKIPGTAFLAALKTSPALGEALFRMTAQRLRHTYQLFQDAAFETLEVRLARQILYLAAVGSRQTPGGARLTGRHRQSDLADLLGATTRSIITILNAWRGSGLVVYDTERAQLTIADMAGLRAVVEGHKD